MDAYERNKWERCFAGSEKPRTWLGLLKPDCYSYGFKNEKKKQSTRASGNEMNTEKSFLKTK